MFHRWGSAVLHRARPQYAWSLQPAQRWCHKVTKELPGAILKDKKVARFRKQLHDPDHVSMSPRRARQDFGLTNKDLQGLKPVIRENPYGDKYNDFLLYWKPDVVKRALQLRTEEQLVSHYRETLDSKYHADKARKIYGMAGVRRWYHEPTGRSPEGMKSIQQGLISNTVVCGLKAGAFTYTGSAAIFADMMHSAADAANYLYRLMSLRWSKQQADVHHPYGYAPLRYICADRSFVSLLMIGGIIPLLHGIHEITQLLSFVTLAPPPNLLLISGSVLGGSVLMEMLALRAASAEIKEQAKERNIPFKVALLQGTDIMSSATFLEAGCGVVGGLVGMTGLFITFLTGNAVADAAASVLMAGIVTGTASFLLGRTGSALLGQTIPVDRVTSVISMLEEDEVVEDVYDVKTQVFGNTARFKAEVHFNAEAVTRKRLQLENVSSKQAQQLHDELKCLKTVKESEDWLMRNDAQFMLAISHETTRLKYLVRSHLSEYQLVYVDLNPW
eukprot:Sspe_Gene.76528::Locus_47820_Transcript_2_2_Confidence_0.750_Length_1789::g.76528::m.76528/K14696/SLC30A9, ZNT9; solute carrier family 30 (zinc transporter), member 9